MKPRVPVNPPKWAQRFLRWYRRPQLAGDPEGDLNEFFERNVKTRGVSKAKLIYIVNVFKFLRPYTARKPRIYHLLFQWIMVGSYIETRLREISIRKVLGATEEGLVYLLSKNFVLLLALAALIALPATDFFFAKYVLSDYGTNAPVPWVELMIGMLAVIAMAFVMVALHTLLRCAFKSCECFKEGIISIKT